MSPSATLEAIAGKSFPRVSGDEPWAGALTPGGETFSPRERG